MTVKTTAAWWGCNLSLLEVLVPLLPEANLKGINRRKYYLRGISIKLGLHGQPLTVERYMCPTRKVRKGLARLGTTHPSGPPLSALGQLFGTSALH